MRHLRPQDFSLIAAADHQRVSCGDPQSFPSFSTITVSDSDPSTGFQQVSPMKTSRFQRIRSGLARFAILPALLGTAGAMLIASTASAQQYTSSGSTTSWDSARWSTNPAGSPTGTYNGAWLSGSAFFANTGTAYSFSKMVNVGGNTGSQTVTLGNVTLAENATVGVANNPTTNNRITFSSSVITGSANSFINFGSTVVTAGAGSSITKNGAGGMALTGGAYTGGFTLNDGLVVAAGNNALGTGALTITGGAIGGTGNRILGVSSVAVDGDFQMGSLSGLGGNSVTAGIATGSGNVVLNGTRTITLGNNGEQKLSGIVSGGTGLKFAQVSTGLSGAGFISLTGASANTYGGGTEINGTTVQVSGNSASLSTGPVTMTGADFVQLRISSLSALNVANNLIIDDSAGGKLISNFTSGATLSGNITNNDTTGGFSVAANNGITFTASGIVSGAGGLQVGFGSLAGTVVLSGVNTYLGTTDLDTGTLEVGNNGAIRNDFTIGATAILDLKGFAAAVNSVGGSSLGTIQSSAAGASLTLGGDNSSSALNANIIDFGDATNAISLVKNGTGTLTLQGSTLQYSGLTTVNTGTVVLATTNELLGGAVVNSSGTLAGNGTFTGNLTVNNGSLDLSTSTRSALGSLTAADISIIGAGSDTTMSIASASSYSTLNSGGNIAFDGNLVIKFDNAATYANGTAFQLFNGNTGTSNFASVTTAAGSGPYSGLTFTYDLARGNWYNDGTPTDPQYLIFSPSTGSLVIVPEPSTWAMTLASVGFAGWMARRKKLASKKQLAA